MTRGFKNSFLIPILGQATWKDFQLIWIGPASNSPMNYSDHHPLQALSLSLRYENYCASV